MSPKPSFFQSRLVFVLLCAIAAVGTISTLALLGNIQERKTEQKNPYFRVVKVTADDTDPAHWGKNWPAQYDSYRRTALPTKTRFGGHAGSEALPEEKIERDPWLKRMFLGYAFSIDYRDRRGHAYMLEDQEQTKRLSKPQSGSCLHCHASIMPLYRELGGGDATAGFLKTFQFTYQELNQKLHQSGHAHPVSCPDCHDPDSMKLTVTRPGFLRGIADLAASEAEVPAIETIRIWRQGKKTSPYDPNRDASRGEMRSFVCGQCHVEYYCSTKMPLTFPWGKGLSADQMEQYWDETKFPDGSAFSDYQHKETGAKILKAQHPEFELWSQGIHARSGVSCADCHMPYQRDGASKVSDHWVRSPLLNVNRACQTCHRAEESELLARVDSIQSKNHSLMGRGGNAIVALIEAIVQAQAAGLPSEALDKAREFQRKAQWRLDFIAAENSMGFHAPQEAARVLGEAIDDARQGEIAVQKALLDAGIKPGASAAPAEGSAGTSTSSSPAAAEAKKPAENPSSGPAGAGSTGAPKTVAPKGANPLAPKAP